MFPVIQTIFTFAGLSVALLLIAADLCISFKRPARPYSVVDEAEQIAQQCWLESELKP